MKDRKEEIINATLELAAENGLGTVSMQQIADRVGITKASLYNHFSSRDEIVDAMYERLREASRMKAEAGRTDYDRLTEDLCELFSGFQGVSCSETEDPEEVDPRAVQGTSDMKRIEDLKGNPLLLFVNPWSVRMVEERNPKLKLSEFGNMEEFR